MKPMTIMKGASTWLRPDSQVEQLVDANLTHGRLMRQHRAIRFDLNVQDGIEGRLVVQDQRVADTVAGHVTAPG